MPHEMAEQASLAVLFETPALAGQAPALADTPWTNLESVQ